MNTVERRRGIEIRPDGSLWDHATFRLWLDQQDAARPGRAHVERLSRLTDVPAPRSRQRDATGEVLAP